MELQGQAPGGHLSSKSQLKKFQRDFCHLLLCMFLKIEDGGNRQVAVVLKKHSNHPRKQVNCITWMQSNLLRCIQSAYQMIASLLATGKQDMRNTDW